MLRLLHSVASHGWVYDRIQDLVGAREVYRRLGRHLVARPSPHWLLDVGGGTGRTRRVLSDGPATSAWIWKQPKLAQLRRTGRNGVPVQGDATRMPFRTASVDLVVCVDVSHHLTDGELDVALSEVQRVLHPSGRLVFLDAVLNERWIGRTLWGLDRGSHPRRAADLRAAVTRAFRIRDEEQFRLATRIPAARVATAAVTSPACTTSANVEDQDVEAEALARHVRFTDDAESRRRAFPRSLPVRSDGRSTERCAAPIEAD